MLFNSISDLLRSAGRKPILSLTLLALVVGGVFFLIFLVVARNSPVITNGGSSQGARAATNTRPAPNRIARAPTLNDLEARRLAELAHFRGSQSSLATLMKAAAQGSAPAQYGIGVYYSFQAGATLGFDPLLDEVRDKLINQSYPDMRQSWDDVLTNLDKNLTPKERAAVSSRKMSIEWSRNAAARGDVAAQVEIGGEYWREILGTLLFAGAADLPSITSDSSRTNQLEIEVYRDACGEMISSLESVARSDDPASAHALEILSFLHMLDWSLKPGFAYSLVQGTKCDAHDPFLSGSENLRAAERGDEAAIGMEFIQHFSSGDYDGARPWFDRLLSSFREDAQLGEPAPVVQCVDHARSQLDKMRCVGGKAANGVSTDAQTENQSSTADSHAVAPSFDCTKVRSQVLRFICATPALATLDNELAAAYEAALAATPAPDQLRLNERNWIAQRNNSAANVDGLTQMYNERITTLRDMASQHSRISIGQLRSWSTHANWRVMRIDVGNGPECWLTNTHFDASYPPNAQPEPQSISFVFPRSRKPYWLFAIEDDTGSLPTSSIVAVTIDGQSIMQSSSPAKGDSRHLIFEVPSDTDFLADFLRTFAAGRKLQTRSKEFVMTADLPGADRGAKLIRKLDACLP